MVWFKIKSYLLNVCVLQQITGVTENGQCIHRLSIAVTAAETLPTLSLINGDDLGAKQAYEQGQH